MTPSGNSGTHALPYSFGQARTAVTKAASNMIAAEETLRQAYRDAAQKEETYRVELAKEITRQHGEGVAWTACQDMARGNQHVAHLRFERDVAEGVKEAAQAALWRLTADRRDLGRLVDWSMRVSPLGQAEPPHGFEDVSARRAAWA